MKVSIILQHQDTGEVIELKNMGTTSSRSRTIEKFALYSELNESGLHDLVDGRIEELAGFVKIGYTQDTDLFLDGYQGHNNHDGIMAFAQ